jgi:phage terminase small subunit
MQFISPKGLRDLVRGEHLSKDGCFSRRQKETERWCCGVANLTEKQQRFVDEYLIDLNATQAAIRAGYSVRTANEQGARLLANVSIQNNISKRMAERSRRTGVNQDRVVIELAKIAFINAADVIDPDDATIKEGATTDDTAAIQSVKVKVIPTKEGEGVEREIRLNDKLKALELLGRHLGMWDDRLDVHVNIPVVISGEDKLED